jgi:hypothetical protein
MGVRHSARLIGTENAGNLLAARTLEMAATLAQLTLINWQPNGRPISDNLTIVTNYAGSINRLASFGPRPMQSVSIAFWNIADQLLRTFTRLKNVTCRAPASRNLPCFGRGLSLENPSLRPASSQFCRHHVHRRSAHDVAQDRDLSMGGPLARLRAHLTRVHYGVQPEHTRFYAF